MKKIEYKSKVYTKRIMGLCYSDVLSIREGAKLLGMNRETFRTRYKAYEAEQEQEIIDCSEEVY